MSRALGPICCAIVSLPAPALPQELRLGVVNERPDRPDFALSQYALLHDYLASRLAARGIRLGRLRIAQDLSGMAEDLRAGEVDALIEGVMPTLFLERETGVIVPELVVWRKGQREYRSVYFTRRESPVESLADLAGRTVVFEAPRSTSAYFVPKAVLSEQGLQVQPLAEPADPAAVSYVFAGSELNQAYWVQRGQADAGAFNDGDWERTPAKIRAELRIFARTPPLLRWLLSLRPGLAAPIRESLLDELERMHDTEEGRAALAAAERIARFERLTEADRLGLERWRSLLARIAPTP